MPVRDLLHRICSRISIFPFSGYRLLLRVSLLVVFGLACLAQAPQPGTAPAVPPAEPRPPVVVPAGTRFALALTHPIQTRRMHRGDDIYAQITSPVTAEDQLAIPPGTYIQGKLEKLEPKAGRGKIHLRSVSMTFPNGYVVTIPGPMTLENVEGYTWQDPGGGRQAAAILLPLGGAGAGAAIGYAAGNSGGTVAPAICAGPDFGCIHPDNHSGAKGAVIGAMVGSAAGGIGSLFLLLRTHDYFLEVGAPVDASLQEPLSLDRDRLADAIARANAHPAQLVGAARPAGQFGCSHGQTWCSGRCVDSGRFMHDTMNCGSCGNMCSAAEKCDLGSCRPVFP